MNKLQVFNNSEFGQIRTIEENGQVLFAGIDIAKALGYKNPNKAVTDHCPHLTIRYAGVQTGIKRDGAAAIQQKEMLFIPESDLYRLIFNSKLPSAEKFTDWVTSEVLPSIRKHGNYGKTPLKDVVNMIRLTQTNMKEQGATPHEIAVVVDTIMKQYGIVLPGFVVEPESFTLKDAYDMVDYVYSQARGKGHKLPSYEDFITYKSKTKMLEGD